MIIMNIIIISSSISSVRGWRSSAGTLVDLVWREHVSYKAIAANSDYEYWPCLPERALPRTLVAAIVAFEMFRCPLIGVLSDNMKQL